MTVPIMSATVPNPEYREGACTTCTACGDCGLAESGLLMTGIMARRAYSTKAVQQSALIGPFGDPNFEQFQRCERCGGGITDAHSDQLGGMGAKAGMLHEVAKNTGAARRKEQYRVERCALQRIADGNGQT